ncbi:MAG: macrolide ABC transporter ATP-binding protein [delta proteobacterium ML8_D]|jgi:putative ABC transport system ATP-binding protein|nr:MAG: macrolide ABC transporter ATP-binding protein [delta proteobacterium ML8_D]
MSGKIIDMKEIVKIYKTGDMGLYALRGVDLEIRKGEFISIMGPSGSGKSTLMNIIGCLDTPTAGSYIVEEEDVSKLKDDHLAEIRNKKIGFVFQTFNLLPRFNIIGNIELPLIYSKSAPIRIRRTLIDKVVDSVGLTGWKRHRPGELSGGQRQRVAIARALVNNPSLILADEPTGNLDSRTGEEIIAIFQKLNREGKTIILVTHELEIAMHTSRIIYLKDGIITNEEIIDSPVDAIAKLNKMPGLEDRINNSGANK